MRSIHHIPRPKHDPKSVLNLIGKRAAEAVPIEVWSEVADSALRSRTTTRLVTSLARYLRFIRRAA